MARGLSFRRLFSIVASLGLATVLPAACGGSGATTGLGVGGAGGSVGGGCQKDTDCKGDRICVAGTCVDPGTTTGSGTGGSTSHTTSTSSTSGTGGHSSGSTSSTSGAGGSSSGSTGSTSSGAGGSSSGTTSSTSGTSGTTTSSTSSTGSTSGTTTSSTSTSSGTSTSSSTSSSSGSTCGTNPNVDSDGDGWTPAQGDCNDCDPKVNPGAVDVTGDPGQVDHDCNSKYDPPVPCDSVLALDDVSGIDGAKAIDLCQFTTASAKNWGVISSQYVRADGAAFASPGAQVGLQPGFGPNVHPQGGQTMLALSSGYARTPSQAGNCGSSSCNDNATATPPPGFPQAIGGCAGDTQISDDVALQIDVRTPTNATGYAFSSKFYTMEFPYWLCNGFNDEFVVLASPAPAGAINGNLVFDAMQNPASAVFSFLTACDPTQSAQYAGACIASFGSCPSPPNPYCPSGMAELQGTGFDVWDTSSGNAGATVWVKTQAPVQGGSEVTLRFTVWDGGDQAFDSTVLIDNFQWITSGAVSLGTAVLANPK